MNTLYPVSKSFPNLSTKLMGWLEIKYTWFQVTINIYWVLIFYILSYISSVVRVLLCQPSDPGLNPGILVQSKL